MATPTVHVWDIAVRLFHWSLVVFFTIAYVSGEEESLIHIYSGYVVLGLIIFRILWGFIGSKYARFSDFLYAPGKMIAYLRSLARGKPQHYLGHNPAGGWMIIALLLSILLTSISGLKVYGLEGHGPLAADQTSISLISNAYANGDEREKHDNDEHEEKPGEEKAGEDEEEYWEELHEFFANLTVLLIVVHIAGVLISSALHGENLVKAMITGRKRLEGN